MPRFAYPIRKADNSGLELSKGVNHCCFAQLPGWFAREFNYHGLKSNQEVFPEKAFLLYVKSSNWAYCDAWAKAINASILKQRYKFTLKAHPSVKGLDATYDKGPWWSIQWPAGTLWDEAYGVTKLIFKQVSYTTHHEQQLAALVKNGATALEAMVINGIQNPNGYVFPCGRATFIDQIKKFLAEGPAFHEHCTTERGVSWTGARLGDRVMITTGRDGRSNVSIYGDHKPFDRNLGSGVQLLHNDFQGKFNQETLHKLLNR